MSDFAGFPVSALDFYDDLEVDNTRSFWEQHKPTYDTAVRAPMQALAQAGWRGAWDVEIFGDPDNPESLWALDVDEAARRAHGAIAALESDLVADSN